MRKYPVIPAIACAMALALAGCRKPQAKVTIPAPGAGLFGPGAGGPGGIPLTEMPEGPFAEPEDFADPAAQGVFVDVHFDYNKSDIRASERPILEDIANYMLANPNLVIKVEGHCDERGSNEYNLALGERRALSIRDYLSGLGVAPGKIYTISYGEERPLCDAPNESCWSRNRRGHFLLARQ